MAPDDEIVAELLALQSELVQQSAINRSRVAGVLALALQDMPAQAEAAATRKAQEAAIVAYQAVSLPRLRGYQLLSDDMRQRDKESFKSGNLLAIFSWLRHSGTNGVVCATITSCSSPLQSQQPRSTCRLCDGPLLALLGDLMHFWF